MSTTTLKKKWKWKKINETTNTERTGLSKNQRNGQYSKK